MITFIVDVFLVQLGEVHLREKMEVTNRIPRIPLVGVSSVLDRDAPLHFPLFIYRSEVHVLQVRNFPRSSQYLHTDNRSTFTIAPEQSFSASSPPQQEAAQDRSDNFELHSSKRMIRVDTASDP